MTASKLRYFSLFSGMECASLAFEPLGWKPVAFSEVDPHACSLLSERWPGVPNLGDVKKITEQKVKALGKVDLIIGGWPCQDISVAGNRKGLEGERSGLFYDAIRLVQWSREHCGLRWVINENVGGLKSSNKGRDFAEVVGNLCGAKFDVPENGWQQSGAAVGQYGLTEWRLLDAQWFGVPQRRQRYFFVTDFGDWTSRAPVLLERESLRRNTPPRRREVKEIAGNATACFGGNNSADTILRAEKSC